MLGLAGAQGASCREGVDQNEEGDVLRGQGLTWQKLIELNNHHLIKKYS